ADYLKSVYSATPSNMGEQTFEVQSAMRKTAETILDDRPSVSLTFYDQKNIKHTADINQIHVNYMSKEEYEKMKTLFDLDEIDYASLPDWMNKPNGDPNAVPNFD